MKRLAKTRRLTVRYSDEQLREIAKAAGIVSREKGETVDESVFVRECSVKRAREVIESTAA